MARTPGRRAGDQYGRRRDEEYGRDEDVSDRNSNREQNTDSLIADMAKGFVEAQAKIAAPAAGGNQDMLDLLEKISRQLDKLQAVPAWRSGPQEQWRGSGPPETGSGQGLQASGGQQGQQTIGGQGQQAGQQTDLSAIFSQLLSAGKAAGGTPQKSAQEGAGAKQDTGGSGQGQQAGQGQVGKTVTAQTAAQTLAQAQYELANELEASLTKLKQVISESEQLADRISNLLGQEGGSRQT